MGGGGSVGSVLLWLLLLLLLAAGGGRGGRGGGGGGWERRWGPCQPTPTGRARMAFTPRSFPAYSKIHSILTAASEELPDAPLYLNLHDVCKTLRCTPPRHDAFRSALVNAGYR